MWRISFRGITEHKARFALTTFAVVIGVGFVVAAFVVTDTVRSAVSGLFTDIYAGIDVTVRAESNLDTGAQGGPASRGRIPDSVVATVEAVDGVKAAQGSVGGYAQLLDEQGEAVTTTGAPLIGTSWGDVEEAIPATIDDGRPPQGPDEVVIDRDTAEEYDLEVGDRTIVLLGDDPTDPGAGSDRREVEIVGVFTFGETNSLMGARLTGFDLASAQEAFHAEGKLDTVDIVAEDGVDRVELARRIQRVLPEGIEAVDIAAVTDEGEQSVEGFTSVFQNVLLAFAGVALLVSGFFINNTFAILLGQRTRELALLRAVGASRRQIVGSVVLESGAVGVLASVLGIAFGMVLALGLQSLLTAGGFVLPEESLQLAPRTVVAALVVGVPVTLLAAWFPARRAARVQPVEALRDGPALDDTGGRRRLVVGGALLGVGVVAVVLALFVLSGSTAVFGTLAVGAVLVFIGAAALSPLLAVPVTSVLGRLVARGLPGRLARQNAMRAPQRTARAASALMIGLALVTVVFVVGTSIKDSFAASVEGSVRADFVVSNPSFTGFSPTVASSIAALDQIDEVTGVRQDRFLIDGEGEAVVAVDPAPAAELVDIDVLDGDLVDLGPGGIAIHEDESEDRNLTVGDRVEVAFASGAPRDVEVVAVYGDATYAGNFLIDLDTFAEAYPANSLDLYVFAGVADGVDPDAARSAIEGTLTAFPQLELQDTAEFEQSQRDQLNQILVSVNGLLGLALFIALLGISNTLALAVLERTREIGLLRAVGMSRRQVRAMVRRESVLVALFGALLGVVIGLVLGVGVTLALPESVVTLVRVPWVTLVVVVIVATLFGVLAGLLPARRAARLDVLDAIAHQ